MYSPRSLALLTHSLVACHVQPIHANPEHYTHLTKSKPDYCSTKTIKASMHIRQKSYTLAPLKFTLTCRIHQNYLLACLFVRLSICLHQVYIAHSASVHMCLSTHTCSQFPTQQVYMSVYLTLFGCKLSICQPSQPSMPVFLPVV